MDITAIVHVEYTDTGELPVGSHLPIVLWPMADKAGLRHLIEQLASQGITRLVIYGNTGIGKIRQSLDLPADIHVEFQEEQMPRGSAGFVLDVASDDEDNFFLVMHGNMTNLPDVKELVAEHGAGGADMTVVLGLQNTVAGLGRDANQLYICSRSVLAHIPAVGYCDIKETLIPKLIASGNKVHAIHCDEGFGNTVSPPEYRDAACENLHEVKQTALAAGPGPRSRKTSTKCPNWLAAASKLMADRANRVIDFTSRSLPGAFGGDNLGWPLKLAGFLAVLICLLASYWNPTIIKLWRLWMGSDEFSSGLLVPFLAVYILFSRRKQLVECPGKPALFLGLCAFGFAQAMRFCGLWIGAYSAGGLSFVMSICAIVLLVFGWRLIWRIWPVLLFLFLMLPLPGRLHKGITQPLQSWATTSAVYGLETIGYEVVQQGNTIILNDTSVGVAEACSGLRMLTAFIVISALIVLLVERRWWQKMIILTSSIPIAFLCNTIRLIITAIAFTYLDIQQWEKAFHDFGGLAMMPLALGIIVAELWLLNNIFLQPGTNKPTVIVRRKLTANR